MTTWYRDAGAIEAGMVANTVRPDLWSAGSHCWSRASPELDLADWGPLSLCRPDEAAGVPGVAEALVLAGLVVEGIGWVETADPRTKGAA